MPDHEVAIIGAGLGGIGAGIARTLLGLASRADRGRPSAAVARIAELSPREREILAGVARGRGNAVIAAELYLSPKTVRNQVSMSFTKLGVSSRGEAMVLAREAGLGLETPDRQSR